jgi:co-chaperonin GroES (HSP10)
MPTIKGKLRLATGIAWLQPEPEVQTDTALSIPDNAQLRPNIGVVLQVGDQEELPDDILRLEIGDRAVYPRYAGMEFNGGILVTQSEIKAVLHQNGEESNAEAKI